MTKPHSYVKDQAFATHEDVRTESGRENWSAVFGLLVFPVLLLLAAFSFFKLFNGGVDPSSMAYESGGFLNSGPQTGVGGAPPTLTPVRQTDLFVSSSNFITGTSTGFISQAAYEKKARVYLSAQTMYEQDCTRDGQTTRESQKIMINKGADTYAAQSNTQSRPNGFLWTVDFDLSAPVNLCPIGYEPGRITQSLVDGRVFLSQDGGITPLSDPETNTPLEVSLTP